VPVAVPGVVFLSGGQSEETATVNLDAINRYGQQPWQLSFSFGRALQASALRAWADDPTDLAIAQGELQRRAAETAAARTGTYAPSKPAPAMAAHA
jgi:fructose-bisphosphate aldolase class I